ncbi:MAG: succinate dehydrogenase assembly factor 2 [Gammaproteobacteria bacterium]|nr:succinate dehydrogenase assembly factor 2 [Gammaproteobacteria bacterium]
MLTDTTNADGRLRWRCRRGMLELDVILENFLDYGFADLTLDEQIAFEELLNFSDQELLEYFLGHNKPESAIIADVVQCIRNTPSY